MMTAAEPELQLDHVDSQTAAIKVSIHKTVGLLNIWPFYFYTFIFVGFTSSAYHLFKCVQIHLIF